MGGPKRTRVLTQCAASICRTCLVFLLCLISATNVSAQVRNAYAITDAAINIDGWNALLNGRAGSPSQNGVTLSFDFGTSTDYGQTIAASWVSSQIASGSIYGSFAGNAVNLRCGTKYYYRARITRVGNGTVTGAQASFSTLPCLAIYNFDDASLNDSSENSYTLSANGILGNTPAFSVSSPARGNAFSGTCGYRTFRHDTPTYLALPSRFPNLGVDGKAFTITAWIRTTDNTLGQRIFVDDENNNGGFGLSLGDPGPGRLRFYTRGTGSWEQIVLDTPNVISNNQWFFVAAVADVPNKKKSIYVFDTNGTIRTSVSSTWSVASFGLDSGIASIGGETTNSPEYGATLSGDLDEVSVYAGALDESAFQTLLMSSRACSDVTSSSQSTLVASPTTVTANGSGMSALTVTLRSASKTPIAGKTVTLTANNGSSVITPVQAVTNANGVATFTVTDSTVETVTYTATNTSDGITIANTASVAFADYALEAVEAGKTAGTNLYTKQAGSKFALDVLAATKTGDALAGAFAGVVNVDIVDQTTVDANGCGTTTLGCTVTPPSYTFLQTDSGRKSFSFDCAKASPNVRVRLTSGKKAFCSKDNFAIRPGGFSVSSTANADVGGASTTNKPVFKAGVAGFSVIAKASAGYQGTPKIRGDQIAASVGTSVGGLSGSFNAADASTGVAAMNNAAYSEVGYFKFKANAIYDDTFTAVDQSNNDCISDYSTTANSDGKIGCYFGNVADTDYFGRFIPDHFTTSIAHGCYTFTYSGQPFSVTVTARNRLGNITKNYEYGDARGFSKAVTLSDANSANKNNLTNTAISASSFAAGSATNTSTYAFSSEPSVPVVLTLRAVESAANGDGISSAGGTEGNTPIRSGRIALYNAIGSELLPLKIPLVIQHFTADRSWVKNGEDNCSILTQNNFSVDFSGAKNGIAACHTALSVSGVPPNQSLTLSAPSTAKSGWATLTLNLGNSANGRTCIVAGDSAGPAETPLNRPWLKFNWKGVGVANPSARASFGWRKPGPLLYLRERN